MDFYDVYTLWVNARVNAPYNEGFPGKVCLLSLVAVSGPSRGSICCNSRRSAGHAHKISSDGLEHCDLFVTAHWHNKMTRGKIQATLTSSVVIQDTLTSSVVKDSVYSDIFFCDFDRTPD